ncbi:MAG TPA: EamA family transporter, partial [Chromatiaceae bacterium]|nr:EamA family transporter [Chromatiaceae bacterium]
MSVPAAYLAVILIWSTTPLAIQWSGDGPGFLFGVAARMVVGLSILLAGMRLLRVDFPWDRASRRVYLVGGVPLYLAMTSVYWSAQYIPSGWISVIFGLSPIFIG